MSYEGLDESNSILLNCKDSQVYQTAYLNILQNQFGQQNSQIGQYKAPSEKLNPDSVQNIK